MPARRYFAYGLGGLGIAAGSTALYYATSRRLQPREQSTASILKSSTASLTSVIVDNVLKDPSVVDKTVDLLAKAFLHPITSEALKTHFTHEFTDNEETLQSLKNFILRDVIQDPWVSEELILLAKELGKRLVAEPTIWPGQTLDLIKVSALEGLGQERFTEAAIGVAKSIVT